MAVHHYVTMVNKLSCIEDASCKSQTVDQGHETGFQHEQEVVRFVALKLGGTFKRFEELLFHHPVGESQLLLLQQLLAIRGSLSSSGARSMSWSVGPLNGRTFGVVVQAIADGTADLMLWFSNSSHFPLIPERHGAGSRDHRLQTSRLLRGPFRGQPLVWSSMDAVFQLKPVEPARGQNSG